MKQTLLLIAICLFSLLGYSQFETIARGPAFDEPENGFAKILIMKNATTAFILVTNKDGITVKLYDAAHKQVVTKNVKPAYGNLKQPSIEGCFEIDGNITLLISEYDGRVPILYRVVLSGTTGAIESEIEIARLKKISFGAGYAVAFGAVPMPDFIVRKDPLSENYVVANFNTFASESDRRVEVIHFNNQHKEISRSFLSTPENNYKYINILDVCVRGDKEAFALIYAFTAGKAKDRTGELMLANFKNNNENVDYISLDISEGSVPTEGIVKYNKITEKLHVVTQVQISTKGSKKFFMGSNQETNYDINHYIIDPTIKKSYTSDDVNLSDINNKYKELFGSKNSYSGVLQNFYINDDGGYTFLFEGLLVTVVQSSRSTYTTYHLGDIAVLSFDSKSNLKSSTLIPKSQMLNNSIMTGGAGVTAYPLYHYKRDFTAQWLKGGNQFKSFAYLNGKAKNYVLLNDIEENEALIAKGKCKTIQGLDQCDGFAFEVKPNNILPTRSFVFGKPKEKKEHNMAIFSVSDFDRENNIYATLKLEIDGRDRKVKVVWLQPK